MCSYFLSKEPFLRTEVPENPSGGHHQPAQGPGWPLRRAWPQRWALHRVSER